MPQLLSGLLTAALALSTPRTVDISVQPDGRAEVTSSATHNTVRLDLKGPLSSACGSLGGESSTQARIAVVTVGEAVPYEAFMRAANRLQDCGNFRLKLSLRQPGVAATVPPIPVGQKPFRAPRSQPSALCRITGDVIVPCVAYVVLSQRGEIWVGVHSRQLKPSNLRSVSQDARAALATPGLGTRRLFTRSEAAAPFSHYFELLARLRSDGLTDLGIINEEF